MYTSSLQILKNCQLFMKASVVTANSPRLGGWNVKFDQSRNAFSIATKCYFGISLAFFEVYGHKSIESQKFSTVFSISDPKKNWKIANFNLKYSFLGKFPSNFEVIQFLIMLYEK